MDFASQLANLEQHARNAAESGNNNDRNNSPRRGGDRRRPRGPDHSYYGRPQQRPRRDGSESLGAMRSYGYRVDVPANHSAPSKSVEHICLLAITIDDLPYEDIWREWASSGEAQVSLVCHAKYPHRVQSEWLKQRLMVHRPRLGRGNSYGDPEYLTHAPEWGSVEITRAMVDLLKDGLRIGKDSEEDMRFSTKRFRMQPNRQDDDKPVDRFLFVSESCIPVTTLKAFVQETTQHSQSWVNARNRQDPGTPQNKYEHDQFARIHRVVPQACRTKADQWVLLARHDAHAIVELDRGMPPRDQFWQSFRSVKASDEMYMPTCLAVLQATFLKRPVTYTEWTVGARNPTSYSQGLNDFSKVARLARQRGCLVARKFVPYIAIPGSTTKPTITGAVGVDEWKREIEAVEQEFKKDVETPVAEDNTGEGQIEGSADDDAQKEVETPATDDITGKGQIEGSAKPEDGAKEGQESANDLPKPAETEKVANDKTEQVADDDVSDEDAEKEAEL